MNQLSTRPSVFPRLHALRPSHATVAAIRERNLDAPFSYAAVGATRSEPPPSWFFEQRDIQLGTGKTCFEAAVRALRAWQMFALSWVRIHDVSAPIREGEVVAFSSRQLGLWTVNTCRIVYVVDEDTPTRRCFGFAYGTLADHAVAGEERFVVDWDAETEAVRYEITKFSDPQHALLRAVGPITRSIQCRFTTDSLQAMREAVQP